MKMKINNPSPVYNGSQHQVERIINLVRDATVRLSQRPIHSITALHCIEALAGFYNFTSVTIRQIIARNPDYTLSMKLEPLMGVVEKAIHQLPQNIQATLYSDMLDDSLEFPGKVTTLPGEPIPDGYIVSEGTQPMTPPEPPRPASDDKRDFDRPNAPPRPSTDREDPSGLLGLDEIQAHIGEWSRKNFGRQISKSSGPLKGVALGSLAPLLGIGEENGELLHVTLKHHQGIRGYDSLNKYREERDDAVADIMVYLCDYAEREGISLLETLNRVFFKVVEKRDWKAQPVAAADWPIDQETANTLNEVNQRVEAGGSALGLVDRGHLEFPAGTLGSELKFDPNAVGSN